MALEVNPEAFGLAGAATIMLGSVAGGMLNYGTYGYLRDKGWGTWKSGAAVGAISGGLAALAVYAFGYMTARGIEARREMGVAGLPTFGRAPRHMQFAQAALPLLHVR
jgi:hypothetical protein